MDHRPQRAVRSHADEANLQEAREVCGSREGSGMKAIGPTVRVRIHGDEHVLAATVEQVHGPIVDEGG